MSEIYPTVPSQATSAAYSRLSSELARIGAQRQQARSAGSAGAAAQADFQKSLKEALVNRNRTELERYFPGVAGKNKGAEISGSEEYRRIFRQMRNGGEVSTSKLAPELKIKEEIARSPEHKKLYDTATDFQAVFINLLLKAMRSTLNRKDDPLYGGQSQEIFEDMLYDEYSQQMSRYGSFDLADQLYRQLSPGLGKIPEKGTTQPQTDSSGSAGQKAPGKT